VPRRVIAAVVAGLLAVVGAALLVGYVSQADARAMAGLDAVDVLVVTKPIAEGTSSADLKGSIEATTLPAAAVVPEALTSLDSVKGLVTVTGLVPGEQLVPERFSSPESLTPSGAVDVPDGQQEVSVLLDAQRVLGGQVSAGDHVGVFVSLTEPDRTSLSLQKVLVTRIAGTPPADGESSDASAAALDGSVLVTLALNAHDAEKVVFGAEHGAVWLSLQNDATATGGAAVVTEENVFQ
jgi:pilus assembly protein CpaB